MGTGIAEAFTHVVLENNYFSWLCDYKINHPVEANLLKTECDEDVDKNVYKPLCCGACGNN